MGKFTFILSTLTIGIALGLNFLNNLEDKSVTYILLAVFILSSITAAELNFVRKQLDRKVTENHRLEAELAGRELRSLRK